jgi:hypothetical protein
MSSVTSWTRLEPRTRSETLPGLEARIHDPLWMLTRQWQFGEFRAEDAGSPISVRVQGEQASLTSYTANGATTPLGSGMPLDRIVEREAPRKDGPERAAAGLHFLRLLGSSLVTRTRAWYAHRFPLAPVATQDTQADLPIPVSRLIPDGAKLYDALSANSAGAIPPGFAGADLDAITEVCETYRKWYQSAYPRATTSAWRADTLRYQFSTTAPIALAAGGTGQTELVASSTGASLDWHSFDARSATSAAAATVPLDLTALPAPARFGGMPAARWWEFEEGAMDFGALDAAPEDLGRLVLAEFALVYGNDFFVVPLDLAVGTVCRLASIEVANNFGERLTVPASTSAGNTWRLFQISQSDLFVLPPVAGVGLEGPELEEVALMRDEMANMAWAVEHVVEGPAGIVRCNERENVDSTAPTAAASTLASDAAPVFEYRLATSVPDNWYPLVPKSVPVPPGNAPRAMALELARPSALGRFLGAQELGTIALNEEELPRNGLKLTRRWKYVRWVDGSTHLWIGRERTPGRGEGSSGLQFDLIVPRTVIG